MKKALAIASLILLPVVASARSISWMMFFDWGQVELSAKGLETIESAVAQYSRIGHRLTVSGYTDTSEPNALDLSWLRANAVKEILILKGVPAEAIVVVGKGTEGLLVPTPVGVREPQNRRAQIIIE
jgi:outer membrane protein OmpA-like peptidoglycan-associated protein